MFTGQYQIAKLTALELRAQLPLTTTDDYLPMLDFLEMFLAVPLHVMVRFGRWYDILAEPLPAVAGSDDNRFSATLAVQRYASRVRNQRYPQDAGRHSRPQICPRARGRIGGRVPVLPRC